MFLLRRAATRAICTPTLFTQPRFLSTASPALRLARQQKPQLSRLLQTRFASDDASKRDEVENFAQTAAEAPVDADLTPVQQEAQAAPTDSSAAVTPEALNVAEKEPVGKSRRRPDNIAHPPNQIIYIGNLFYEVTPEQIERVFSRFGPLEHVRIVYDNRGVSRGFGYVHFKNVVDAQAAVDNLDMQVFEGRNLVVQFTKPQSSDRIMKRAAVRDSPSEPSKSLFIGNMSYEMSDKDLNDLFRDIRNVTDVRVAIDRRTGQPRGFAHADFIDIASATRAKEMLHGKEAYGRALRVDYSTSRRREGAPRSSTEKTPSSSPEESAP